MPISLGLGLSLAKRTKIGAQTTKPINTVLPTISGTPQSGQTLSVTNGTWLNSPTGFTYQCYADGVPISGATASTFLLTSSQVGATITWVVTASNVNGSAAATSNAVGPVAAVVVPAAPLMTWASTSSDNTPDFSIDLPSGAGDGTDAAAGDVLHIQYSNDAWVTPQEYVSYTLLTADITADIITKSGVTAVADGTYVFRARLERSGAGNSAWTSDVAVTISTAVSGLTLTAQANPTAITGGGITSPATWAGVAIGTASSDRIVAVSFTGLGATNTASSQLSAVTIGGVSATAALQSITSSRVAEIWYALVTSGTTATISATVAGGSGFIDDLEVAVFTLTGSATASVSGTVTTAAYPNGFSNTNTATIPTIPSGGVAILVGQGDSSNTSVGSFSWNNGATQDYQQRYAIAGGANVSDHAHSTTSGATTETMTSGNGGSGWVAAVFQP